MACRTPVNIDCRPDRGGGYDEAIAKALPDAEQVADRWHLMENSSRAFLDAVGKSMRQTRQAVGSNVVDPKLLTYAERLQYEGYCAVRRPMRRYKDWPRREYQFGRLFGKPVIVENWFAMSCVVNASMYSERSRVRWITGCHGLTTVGKKGRETPWRCGAR